VNALHKILALSWSDRLLLLEAVFYLTAARLAIASLPFRHIAPHLGHQILPGLVPVPKGPPPEAARRIARAVQIISGRTPWESACLAQGIAGRLMLGRRGLPGWLFLGTRKDEHGDLIAHAWLQSGDQILLGGESHGTFTMLSGFGEPSS
jgi:hypothetical protein